MRIDRVTTGPSMLRSWMSGGLMLRCCIPGTGGHCFYWRCDSFGLRFGGFRVTGKICTQCSLMDPVGGELTVEASALPIQSIDIHLLRVESILIGEKIATESSLIQTTQISDGDVCRQMSLPIYIILPRLVTCPTIFAGPFSVEFKVTIAITFVSDLSKKGSKSDPKNPMPWTAMENVPLELVRTK